MADLGETPEIKGQKMEVDYSSTVDKKIPQCEALALVILCAVGFRGVKIAVTGSIPS